MAERITKKLLENAVVRLAGSMGIEYGWGEGKVALYNKNNGWVIAFDRAAECVPSSGVSAGELYGQIQFMLDMMSAKSQQIRRLKAWAEQGRTHRCPINDDFTELAHRASQMLADAGKAYTPSGQEGLVEMKRWSDFIDEIRAKQKRRELLEGADTAGHSGGVVVE